ncbi:Tip elongation protein [Paramyrothecium foliicola]|nr:Tip elongation protein [Paramyrothecium foliicola]
MASVTTTTTATTIRQSRQTPSRSLRKPVSTASTPNLNSAYLSHAYSRQTPRTLGLSRKSSFAALTASTLASIPDVTDNYAFETALNDTIHNMPPGTPGRATADDVVVGDVIDVPGGMLGTVRFVGTVQGKKGTFAGVELDPDFANKGKNNGDVDGISYFETSTPGAGIFLPIAKAIRHDSSFGASRGYPMTPTASVSGGLRAGNQNSTNFTPPTPALPKFSASVGPGARAPSPQGKRPRTSLPRPDSPVRRLQMTPGPRPSIGTPAKVPSRYGSPTNNRFAQSVRGTAGDPNKKISKLERMPSLGPRSASALGSASGLDDDATPMMPQHPKTNGSIGSVSSFSNKVRPLSRATAANDEEIERLRAQLEDRDRQLKEQASTLADMEGSLTELQTLIENSDGPGMGNTGFEDKDTSQLRQMLREKNEKIAMLTAEFDAHRADFRSTIDTLEMASTETERVYEKRIEELMADIRELESRNLDVDSVASQLKQLEELVQELEEGLEDARRGEAEARGEVEFLRGEVERTRTELRREREKPASSPPPNAGGNVSSKELEQKEDEIRGLKAIIHSLSRDSIPGTPTRRMSAFMMNGEAVENKIARDNLERQVAELQSILDKKTSREEELEQEVTALRRNSSSTQRNSVPNHRSSLRDSRDTVVMARAMEARGGEIQTHKRANTLDTMLESDSYSNATENSTLWCEICETGGHDILTCTNVFGPEGAKAQGDASILRPIDKDSLQPPTPLDDAHPAPLSPVRSRTPQPPTPSSVRVMPNPMESGPVAGKESGVMDPEKWCAVCERDGHDSVDCPFEDAF